MMPTMTLFFHRRSGAWSTIVGDSSSPSSSSSADDDDDDMTTTMVGMPLPIRGGGHGSAGVGMMTRHCGHLRGLAWCVRHWQKIESLVTEKVDDAGLDAGTTDKIIIGTISYLLLLRHCPYAEKTTSELRL